MVLTIIGVCALIVSIIFSIYAGKKQQYKLQQRQKAKQELKQLNTDIDSRISELEDLRKDCAAVNQLIQERRKTLQYEKQQSVENILKIRQQFEAEQKKLDEAAVVAQTQRATEIESNLVKLRTEFQVTGSQLQKIKNALEAAAAAQLREREKEENQKFYMLNVSQNNLSDIEFLNSIKSRLHDPTILAKLIWTQYYQKQLKLLCGRVLQKDKIAGIYKITNVKTEEAYIGQSVDIAKRWTDHIKCGLGINASATNKLYTAMQKYGIHNFTFELIEQCPKEQLNEKEMFWIGMYDTARLGYNVTKGNK